MPVGKKDPISNWYVALALMLVSDVDCNIWSLRRGGMPFSNQWENKGDPATSWSQSYPQKSGEQ